MDSILEQKLIGSMRGVSVGDAFGLPVESQTRQGIVRILHGDILVSELMRLDGNGFYKAALLGKNKYGGDYRPQFQTLGITEDSLGICSDDTLMTVALAQSLGTVGDIDTEDIIQRSMDRYVEEPFGFGPGHRKIFDTLRGGDSGESLSGISIGNGVMMKQLPLAWYCFLRKIQGDQMDKTIIRIAEITHKHPASLVAAIVHNRLLVDLIMASSEVHFDMYDWLSGNIDFIYDTEKLYSDGSSGLRVTDLLYAIQKDGNDALTLDDIYKRYVSRIAGESQPAFNILSTMGIVYSLFLRDQNFHGLQKAVSIGGDTDSYGAIIGGMIGLLRGEFYPQRLWEGIQPRYRRMVDASIGCMSRLFPAR